MPEIYRFYGIIIRMYLIDREHPSRHIHIKYDEHEAVMELEKLEIIDGSIPKKCYQLVKEWAETHRLELIKCGTLKNFTQSNHCHKFMKLKEIKHQHNYEFLLTFANGETANVDLESLISSYVKPQEINTAHINQEWGCLEFKGGAVDIEPKTLYQFTKNQIH